MLVKIFLPHPLFLVSNYMCCLPQITEALLKVLVLFPPFYFILDSSTNTVSISPIISFIISKLLLIPYSKIFNLRYLFFISQCSIWNFFMFSTFPFIMLCLLLNPWAFFGNILDTLKFSSVNSIIFVISGYVSIDWWCVTLFLFYLFFAIVSYFSASMYV